MASRQALVSGLEGSRLWRERAIAGRRQRSDRSQVRQLPPATRTARARNQALAVILRRALPHCLTRVNSVGAAGPTVMLTRVNGPSWRVWENEPCPRRRRTFPFRRRTLSRPRHGCHRATRTQLRHLDQGRAALAEAHQDRAGAFYRADDEGVQRQRRRTEPRSRWRRGTPGRTGTSTRPTSRSARSCSGTRCASAATTSSSTTRQGMPPVLHFEYEMVLDGRTLERPVNYALVRIVPPEGVTVDPKRRPYVIIDPRAGPRPGHRRLQGRLAGRRRAARRATRSTSSSSSPSPSRARRCSTSARPSSSSCARCASCIRTARSRRSSATARAAGRR